jgi:hypothetical protein
MATENDIVASTGPEPGRLWFERCLRCVHSKNGEDCAAFPNGIPEEIYSGDFDHAQPFPGDGGITFLSVIL